MKVHKLKIWPAQFEAIISGSKRHEVRVNDRDFKEGDEVELHCWNPVTKEYDGRSINSGVGNVTRGFGLPDDLCVFTLIRPRVGADLLIDAS